MQKQFLKVTRDNERLLQDLHGYQEKDLLQQHRIETLEKQLELNRVIRPEMNEKDKQALEKRINQYLREIDKCIALLNE
ncbi:hypothetical protein [Flavihumibacter fluvii]|uniref:hypothetical protein n=1 Tax=Flavihumibacter fluvii TaxID=2838157 RepID=UPI001BDECB6C|nr:hypothetical protein [Flavihumibacter fluvii]ULQ52584.1 hypothetical protein KJS93_21075 [Flavihumibacter fluvii]